MNYAAQLYGFSPQQGQHRVSDILSRLNFPQQKMDPSLENLPGDLQQKVAIARGLLTPPVLFLLHEPITGLDPVSRPRVQKYILKVREIHDTTVLLTSHDQEEVKRICYGVAIIHRGKFVACNTVAALKQIIPNND